MNLALVTRGTCNIALARNRRTINLIDIAHNKGKFSPLLAADDGNIFKLIIATSFYYI